MTDTPDTDRLGRYAYPTGAQAFMRDLTPTETGERFELVEWERKALERLYLSDPRPRVMLVGLPRGFGKTEFAARVAWYELMCQPNALEVVGCAADRDQAKLVHQRMSRIRRASARLESVTKEYRDAIEIPETGAVYRVLSADVPSSFGLAFDAAIFDELHTQPKRDLWDSLYTAVHKRPGAYLLALTTAGHDFTSICREVYEIAAAGTEPRWRCLWIEGQEAIEQRPPWLSAESIEEFRRTLPPHVFQRLHLNQWVQGAAATWTVQEVNSVFDDGLRPTLERKSGNHWLGLDLGLKKDRTAAVVVHKDLDENLLVVDDIRVWEGSRENPVVIGDVEEYTEQARRRFHRLKVLCDPWQAQASIQRLKAKLGESFIEEFTFTSANLRRLSENLYALIHRGQLRCFPDDGLRNELLNIETVSTSYGWRLDHESGGYSDRTMALGMACVEAVQERNREPQIWVFTSGAGDDVRDDVDWIEGKGKYAQGDDD